jgi:inosine-uridine nucleoside N-ribohydrolase
VSAVAVAASAEAFQVESQFIDIETTGELTQGMTVVDRRQVRAERYNFDVVSSIDDVGVVDYFTRAIRRVCQ